MTDQPSSTSQPSMEDILASIRRIIDDEDVKTPAPASAVPNAENPQNTADSFDVDDEAAALALAEYDAAMATDSPQDNVVDSTGETIFPQRDGALWRRVAGHPLSEGETDPLAEEDTLELTETVEDELELNNLLESAGESDPVDDARVLDDVVASLPDEPDNSSVGIGAMTAAGIGATGAAAGGLMGRITGGAPSDKSTSDEEDEVLDLTRGFDGEDSIKELSSAMSDNPRFETEDLPPPEFERVDLDPLQAANTDGEDQLDDSFEAAAVTGLHGDYSGALTGAPEDGDDQERALDDRFYKADELEDMPPELDDAYATSFGGEPTRQRNEGAPTEDEMETVGGLVRDALRGRLPAVPDKAPENALVTGGAEDSAARSLAALARYDAHAPRRIYGGIKITDDDDSPTIEGMVQDTLRPMLRDWLNENLPTLVESMVKQEVDRISARSRRFVRDDED